MSRKNTGHRHRSTKAEDRGGRMGLIVSALLFVVILGVAVAGTLNVSQSADEKGVEVAQQAIERAVVLCYATEGYYPPNYQYLEDYYGVRVDQSRYAVQYEVFAYNVPPSVRVIERGGG